MVGTLKDGQVANADKTIQNGFRQLNTNQWVSNELLTSGVRRLLSEVLGRGPGPIGLHIADENA